VKIGRGGETATACKDVKLESRCLPMRPSPIAGSWRVAWIDICPRKPGEGGGRPRRMKGCGTCLHEKNENARRGDWRFLANGRPKKKKEGCRKKRNSLKTMRAPCTNTRTQIAHRTSGRRGGALCHQNRKLRGGRLTSPARKMEGLRKCRAMPPIRVN